jgi:hypothetical protein
MITSLLILGGAIVAASLYFLVMSIAHAPEGYEDEAGFHFEENKEIVRKRPAAARPKRVRLPVRAGDVHQPAA